MMISSARERPTSADSHSLTPPPRHDATANYELRQNRLLARGEGMSAAQCTAHAIATPEVPRSGARRGVGGNLEEAWLLVSSSTYKLFAERMSMACEDRGGTLRFRDQQELWLNSVRAINDLEV